MPNPLAEELYGENAFPWRTGDLERVGPVKGSAEDVARVVEVGC